MTKLKELQRALELAKEKYAEAQKDLDDHFSRTVYVECTNSVMGKGCGEKTSIGKLTFIQTQWTDRSHDYWSGGEGQTICPKCGNRIRLLWTNEHVVEHKYHFKDIAVRKNKPSY